jgi:hypothetical protein
MPGCARRTAALRIHPRFEVAPSVGGDLYFAPGNLARVLPEDVQEHDEVPGPAVEDPVELRSVMASELAKLTFDLRAMRKGQVRPSRCEQVQPVDLIVEDYLLLGAQSLDESVDRLGTILRPIVNRLQVRHVPRLVVGSDGLE